MAASFAVHPRELSQALDNAYLVGKDKVGNKVSTRKRADGSLEAFTSSRVEVVRILVDGTDVKLYGRGLHTAGIASVVADSGEGHGDVCIQEDAAAELAKALRGVEGAGRKGSQVMVVIDGGLAITAGTETICDLKNEDTADFYAEEWARIDAALQRAETAPEARTPLLLSKDMLQRINRLKSDGDYVDLVQIGGNTCAFKIGAGFIGLAEAIGREGFAAGGPWATGPGSPEQLLGGKV